MKRLFFNIILYAAVIPILLFSIGFTYWIAVDIQERTLNNLESQENLLYNRVRMYIESQTNYLNVASAHLGIEGMGHYSLIEEVHDTLSDFSYIYLTDKKGLVKVTHPYTDFSGENDFGERDWFRTVKYTGRPYVSGSYVSHADGESIIFIAVPIYEDNGEFKGVIGGNIPLYKINHYLNDLGNIQGIHFMVTDKMGKLIATSATSMEYFEELRSLFIVSPVNIINKVKVDDQTFYFKRDKFFWEWYTTTFVSYDFWKSLFTMNKFLMVIPVVLSVTVMIFIYTLNRRMLTPLSAIGSQLDIISKGDYQEIHLTNTTREIEKLVSSVNMMVRGLQKHAEQIEAERFSMLMTIISLLEANDPYTAGHSQRVMMLSKLIGEKLGLPERELKKLETAALLHDIGKIGIPGSIVQKPGRLTKEEYEIIKLHPTISEQVLKHIRDFDSIRTAVLHHHERMDGKGYPLGLKGEEIPQLARIISVADVFDALTSHRPYRVALSFEDAVEYIKNNQGVQFDPHIVQAFLEALEYNKLSNSDQTG
ncbi:HD domain-containing protein [Microaerobacter geothermalis]|uniref:HD domain-containing phosphohydrolase n=1 Tax=Microaerobacter geothermalis TaxID=674972 RepID=UPI001F2C10BC|nr:HD domain-containing phosphohydrolase [Microaerobacter geothermalis]MCF6095373.1 HD domain-containing protein [Microaerobacter geothermalis]